MDAGLVLASQATALLSQLDRAAETLERIHHADRRLYERVQVRFEDLIRTNRQETRHLIDQLRQSTSLPRGLSPYWERLAQLRQDSQPLFAEALAFMQGALIRNNGLDQELCLLADHLLDQLSDKADVPWGRLTVLADSEYFEDLAEIVRLRFPEVSVWSLPLAAHEFGHYIGPRISRQVRDGRVARLSYPFAEVLQRELARSREALGTDLGWYHADECFADIFATYSMGPAYPAACIMLRFNPLTAHVATLKHPSPNDRVATMLGILELMAHDTGQLSTAFGDAPDRLRELWASCTAAAGDRRTATAPPGNADRSLTPLGTELYNIINGRIAGLRYASFSRAAAISDMFRTGGTTQDDSRASRDATLVDVLNGAWLARLRHDGQNAALIDELGRRAVSQSLTAIAARNEAPRA